ncbi:MAG TPA: hypothetical protein VM577_09020 [Anaerovoracaceae bacterium]|nr:hypothetical protein [Anaerovoracaceae bacterium]
MHKKLSKLINTNNCFEFKKPLPCMVQIGTRGKMYTVYVTGIGGNYLSTLAVGKNLKKALKKAVKQVKVILKSTDYQRSKCS